MAIKHTTTKLKKVVISHFWDDRKEEDTVIGLKSEVFLKALGNKHYSDMTLIRSYAIELQESPLKSFNTIICSIRRFTC